MKSFVDGLNDKRISIEVLQKILEVDYQREILLEMIIDNHSRDKFLITIINQFSLKMDNENYCIFFLLSNHEKVLKQIVEEVKILNNNKIVHSVIFNKNNLSEKNLNPFYITPKKWMNRIISHGINRQILHLQFLRDLKFSDN